jgi:hypothetical protein
MAYVMMANNIIYDGVFWPIFAPIIVASEFRLAREISRKNAAVRNYVSWGCSPA